MEMKTKTAIRSYLIDDIMVIARAVTDTGGELRFMPRGTSMLPLLREGRDSVAIKKIQGGARKYDIVLYRRKNGKYALHRVIGKNKSGYIMCGDNQLIKEYGIEDGQIEAVVSAVYRSGKRIDLSGFGSRVYSRLWCFMPLRGCAFFIRRAALKIKGFFLKSNKNSPG